MLKTRALLCITYALRMVRKNIPLTIGQVEPWPEEMPFVSIVIPCYNHGQYLNDAVQSILGQTWQNFEIIIVNDGSDDQGTLEIIKDFRRPRTRIIHLSQNMGPSAARNTGIEGARGKYVCCLDADDKLHPTYLEKAIVTMEVNSGLSFVGSWTQVFGSESRVWYSLQFDPDLLIYYNQFGPATVFKRSAWEKAGGFSDKMREGFEDWEFWVRLTGNGYRGYRIAEKMILYRRMDNSLAVRALSAAEKKEYLFDKIKGNNPAIYKNQRDVIEKIKKNYQDIYSPAPFINLNDRRNYLQMDVTPNMVVSDLNSESTIASLRNINTQLPLIWVAIRPMDEEALDLLYQTTPFVYILPNFLPHYARFEFVQNLKKNWKIQSVQKLNQNPA